jgi:phage terminase large subunit-like protein
MSGSRSGSGEILTIGPAVSRFFAAYLRHPKGYGFGEPFEVEDWEQDFLDEFYRVDEAGRRLYRIGLLGIPRGNGKTPLCAGIGLFELMARRHAPDIFNGAGSKDQARILTDFARAFVNQGKLRTWLETQRRVILNRETQGVMRLMSSDGFLAHGLAVDAAIGDELHAWTSEAQEELWTAFVTALHKRVDSFVLGITTAGFDKGTLLGRLYDRYRELPCEERLVVPGVGPCLRVHRDLENGILMWWYGPPDDYPVEEALVNEELWRAVNPASWVTIEILRKQLAALDDEYDFARLHLNMWTGTREVFIPLHAWRACRSEIEPRRNRPTYVAVDIGLTHDTTCVAWSQPLPLERTLDERISAEPESRRRCRVVSRARVWSANPRHERDRSQRHVFVPDGRVDLEEIEEFILGLARAYDVREVVYDPTFFEGEAQRLAKKGLRVAPMYQHGVHPQVAAQQWYQDVKEGLALHAGDPVIDRHVAQTTGIKTERGWRMTRLGDEPNDAARAISMSHWRASRHAASVYDVRDVFVVGEDE